MGRRRNEVPSYLHHKPSGQAYCRVNGKPVYLGPHNSAESVREYKRIIGKLRVQAPLPPRGGLSVAALLDRFRVHAEAFYRDADGNQTARVESLKFGLRALRELYADLPAEEFGQSHLKAVRQVWIDAGNSRGTVNGRTCMVKQVFAWAADEELVDAAVLARVKAVRLLPKGRSQAPEKGPVRPAPEGDADKVLAVFTEPAHRVMLQLQLLTGMRPGEVCKLKPGYVDRGRVPWRAEFGRHKTAHRGKTRVVYFGPKARELLAPYLDRDPGRYCFDPRDWTENATTEYVGVRVWWDKVRRACKRAGVPHFNPNRLRHTAGTKVREVYGPEGAQHVLDHAHLKTTEVYAERSEALKRKIAEETG
jgi:integrase